jgi:hypothetical protein
VGASGGEANEMCGKILDGKSFEFYEFVQKTLHNSRIQGFYEYNFSPIFTPICLEVSVYGGFTWNDGELDKLVSVGLPTESQAFSCAFSCAKDVDPVPVNKVARDLLDREDWHGNLLLVCMQPAQWSDFGVADGDLSSVVHHPQEFVRLANIEDEDYIAEEEMLAFAMIKHERLGAGACGSILPTDILRRVFEGPNAEVFRHSSWALRCLFQAMRHLDINKIKTCMYDHCVSSVGSEDEEDE